MKQQDYDMYITLPKHEGVSGTRICHVCGGNMEPCTDFSVYHENGIDVKISGIKGHKCIQCGEMLLTSDEVKLIEGTLEGIKRWNII